MAKPVTIRSLAQAAGVSHATVSLALRNSPEVGPATRQRIQDLAAQMGYRKNALIANLFAQLRSERKVTFQSTLALLALGETFERLRSYSTFDTWIRSCRSYAEAAGYGIDSFSSADPESTPERLLKILKARNIRGVLAIDPNLGPLERFNGLWKHCASIVLGSRPVNPRLSFASNDHFSTTLLAVQQVIDIGYSRPGLCLMSFIDSHLQGRFSAGFRTGQLNLPARNRIEVCEMVTHPEAEFKRWLVHRRPDVVLGLHEEILGWITSVGLRVPEDIGFVNIDGNSDLRWAGMDQNHDDLARMAVNTLIGKIHRNDFGVPRFQEGVYVTGTWVDGPTVRRPSALGGGSTNLTGK